MMKSLSFAVFLSILAFGVAGAQPINNGTNGTVSNFNIAPNNGAASQTLPSSARVNIDARAWLVTASNPDGNCTAGGQDTTAGLQAAINFTQSIVFPSTSNGSVELVLPPGFCKISSPLTITVPFVMRGHGTGQTSVSGGSGGTVIRKTVDNGDAITVTTDGGMVFRDFSIDTQGYTPTNGAAISITGSQSGHANVHSLIDNIHCQQSWDCVYFGDAYSWTIQNPRFTTFYHDAVHLAASSNFPDGSEGGAQILGGELIALTTSSTANADFERNGGGDVEIIGSHLEGGAYGIVDDLLYSTGTIHVVGNTIGTHRVADYAAYQDPTTPLAAYGNTILEGNKFVCVASCTFPSVGSIYIGGGFNVSAGAYTWTKNTVITGNSWNWGVSTAGSGTLPWNMGFKASFATNQMTVNTQPVVGTIGIGSAVYNATTLALIGNVNDVSGAPTTYGLDATPGTIANATVVATSTPAVAAGGSVINIQGGSGTVIDNNVLNNNNLAQSWISVGGSALNVTIGRNNIANYAPSAWFGSVNWDVVNLLAPGAPNLLANGGVIFDQQLESVSGVTTPSNLTAGGALYCADQWIGQLSQSGSVINCTRTTDAPTGSSSSLLLTVTTSGSPANADFGKIVQPLPPSVTATLGYGSSTAVATTASFQIKSSITGTFSLAILNTAGTKQWVSECVVSTVNVWHQCSTIIPPITSGVWNASPRAGTFNIVISAGTSHNGATVNSWSNSGAAFASPNQTNLAGTNGATLQISDVQWTITPLPAVYQPAPYALELQRLQQYYWKSFPQGTKPANSGGVPGSLCVAAASTTAKAIGYTITFPTAMAAAPATVTTFNPSAGNANWRDITGGSDAVVNVDPGGSTVSANGIFIGEQTTALTVGDEYCIQVTANARI